MALHNCASLRPRWKRYIEVSLMRASISAILFSAARLPTDRISPSDPTEHSLTSDRYTTTVINDYGHKYKGAVAPAEKGGRPGKNHRHGRRAVFPARAGCSH